MNIFKSYRTLVLIGLVAFFTGCDVLQQLANQNQGGGGQAQQNQVKLEGNLDCNTPNRYGKVIFPKDKVAPFLDLTYATMRPEDQWNNGKNTQTCYGSNKYKTKNAQGLEELKLDVFLPNNEVDDCRDRAVLLFVHNGGFSQAFAPNKSTMRGQAKFAAQLGYVSIVIDYRKGYDFGKGNVYDQRSLTGKGYTMLKNLQGKKVDCREGSEPDPNTFNEAMFRIIQDIRAAHRFIHKNKDRLSINTDKIFYVGSSTGAMAAAHAAYAADETAHWNKLGMGRIQDFGLHPELEGQIKVAGVIADQPALQNVAWIDNNDNVPIFMMQGTADLDVPYETGPIGGLKKYNGGTSQLAYFQVHGSKKMYDRIKSLGSPVTRAKLMAFEGVDHNTGVVFNGGCPRLNGGQRGIWLEGYNFARKIIEAKDKGVSPNITNEFCLFKSPKSGACQAICN